MVASSEFFWRNAGSMARGSHRSGASGRSVSPKNGGGVTPTTVAGTPLIVNGEPITPGIEVVTLLPGAIAHDRDEGRAGPVVRW